MWQGFPCVLLMKRGSCCCQTTGCFAHAEESQNEPLIFLPYRNEYCKRNFIPLLLQWRFLQCGAGRGCWGHCAHKESKTRAIRLQDKETVPGTKLCWLCGGRERTFDCLFWTLKGANIVTAILRMTPGSQGDLEQQQYQPSLTLQWGLNLTSCWIR